MKFTNKDYQWLLVFILIIVIIICFTIIIVANSSYKVNLSMDNNTLEAIKSINWSSLNQKECMPININYPNKFDYSMINYSNKGDKA